MLCVRFVSRGQRVPHASQIAEHTSARMAFAKMYVLQRCRVNNDIRSNAGEPALKPNSVTNIAKRVDHIQSAVNPAYALEDIEQAMIKLIKQHQPAARQSRQVLR